MQETETNKKEEQLKKDCWEKYFKDIVCHCFFFDIGPIAQAFDYGWEQCKIHISKEISNDRQIKSEDYARN